MAIITFSYLLILLLTSLPDLSDAAVFANDAGRNHIRGPKLSTLGTDKNPINYNRVDPVRDCSEMSTRSGCVQSPKCRWCRSDAFDDTCFSKSESWRLPSQIPISCQKLEPLKRSCTENEYGISKSMLHKLSMNHPAQIVSLQSGISSNIEPFLALGTSPFTFLPDESDLIRSAFIDEKIVSSAELSFTVLPPKFMK